MGGCFSKASSKVEDKEISISQNPSAGSPRRLSSDSRPHSSLFSPRKAFTREELERATNGFSESNFLGKGGFGNVHKGILEDGSRVAVKQLLDGSKQGDKEFQAEVDIISRVHHRHLVSLVGYCIAEGVLMLVYEYVPNNSLKFHLHGGGEPILDWPTRLKIALGSAKGLAYLHEDCQPKIIHRDIKSDNILLDLNYEGKIADFGLARIFPDDQTHVEATLAGTFGYLDPEYASTGQLTDKSDVYAFGVILLELVTGFPPNFKTIGSTKSNRLVHWALKRNYKGLLDPRLQMNYNAEEVARVVECAAACVRLPAHSRPRMIQINGRSFLKFTRKEVLQPPMDSDADGSIDGKAASHATKSYSTSSVEKGISSDKQIKISICVYPTNPTGVVDCVYRRIIHQKSIQRYQV